MPLSVGSNVTPSMEYYPTANSGIRELLLLSRRFIARQLSAAAFKEPDAIAIIFTPPPPSPPRLCLVPEDSSVRFENGPLLASAPERLSFGQSSPGRPMRKGHR